MRLPPTGAPRWPAEWEPHDATWLAYPHLSSDWPGKVSAVRWSFVEFVRRLQRHERVRILVRDEADARRAGSALRRGGADLDRISLSECPTDRAWMRDAGPTFVQAREGLQAVCWRFNAWGRYRNWQLDAQVGPYIARAASAAVVQPEVGHGRLVLEGGSIEGNGRGTVLTTEQCLLGSGRHSRNPGLVRKDYEEALAAALGTSTVVWLGGGIAGDDTGGHVDTVARFVSSTTVVAAVEQDPSDENYPSLQDNLARLKAARNQDGEPLSVVELPMPEPVIFEGERMPASYANFYIANRCVLVPTFNDPRDSEALDSLRTCFPDRTVCGIHSVDLVLGGGTLHCLAQQQPRAQEKRPARQPRGPEAEGAIM